jgi:hypothetical protein
LECLRGVLLFDAVACTYVRTPFCMHVSDPVVPVSLCVYIDTFACTLTLLRHSVDFVKGKPIAVKLEYFQRNTDGNPSVALRWSLLPSSSEHNPILAGGLFRQISLDFTVSFYSPPSSATSQFFPRDGSTAICHRPLWVWQPIYNFSTFYFSYISYYSNYNFCIFLFLLKYLYSPK